MGGQSQAAPPLENATPFEQHILSLLTALEHNPSLAFQTPAATGPKSEAQEAIQRRILALGQRAASSPQPLITPTQTPPVVTVDTTSYPFTCPECSSPLRPVTATPTSPFASLELSSPRPPQHGSWSNGGVGESGMSAEKELELLKAQVQDIARVCKVGPWMSGTNNDRQWQPVTSRKRLLCPSRARL